VICCYRRHRFGGTGSTLTLLPIIFFRLCLTVELLHGSAKAPARTIRARRVARLSGARDLSALDLLLELCGNECWRNLERTETICPKEFAENSENTLSPQVLEPWRSLTDTRRRHQSVEDCRTVAGDGRRQRKHHRLVTAVLPRISPFGPKTSSERTTVFPLNSRHQLFP